MRRVLVLLTTFTVVALVGGIVAAAPALAAQLQLSEDPYTNPDSQHKTQVEPDTFAFGGTIVTAFQSGRYFNGGASNIGWATSSDGGVTWTSGFLPGTTVHVGGPYDRASDPSVAYDPKHRTWMISMLGLKVSQGINDVIVSRSTDGLTWNNPVPVALGDAPSYYDKNWTACDTSSTSPFYGNCYTQWDDFARGNLMLMSTSTDGGFSWGPPKQTANRETGVIGGQPVVLASGTVVVPFLGNTGIKAFTSTDGGNTWGTPVLVSNVFFHTPAGGIRAGIPLPSAEVAAPGGVAVAWPDCRFEPACNANDIVMSSSNNGTTWTSVRRIPIDPVGSGVDHFIPGLAVQQPPPTPNSSPNSPTLRLALGYYYYPVSSCSFSTCSLNVGFVFSRNGGATWSTREQLAGPMQLSWLPSTSSGRMVGDYISSSYAGGRAFPVYASAQAPIEGVFQEAMFTTPEAALLSRGAQLASSASNARLTSHRWRMPSPLPTAN